MYNLIDIDENIIRKVKANMNDNSYYVYEFLNPSLSNKEFPDGLPFYVGKGKYSRCIDHFKDRYLNLDTWLYRKIRKLLRLKVIINIKLIKTHLNEDIAFSLEKEFIKKYRDLGIKLSNTTDGGEGKTNCFVSEETRKKMSKSSKGRKISPESIAKRTALRRMRDNYRMSPETKEKLSHIRSARTENYICISPNKDIVLVTNLRKFCIENEMSFARMNQVARSNKGIEYKGDKYKEKQYIKKNKTYKGWECFYESDFSTDKVGQFRYNLFDKEMNFLKSFQNISDIAREYQISEACLCRIALKEQREYKGLNIRLNPKY